MREKLFLIIFFGAFIAVGFGTGVYDFISLPNIILPKR